MSLAGRLTLVDRADPALSVMEQYRLLKVARSTLYYRPLPVSAGDLTVMRRMDELHLAWPFYGSSCCAVSSTPRPAAASKTIRARSASFCGVECAHTRSVSSRSCSADSRTAEAL
jgi:putative transposase